MSISREFRDIKDSIEKIKNMDKNKVMVFCSSAEAANKLVATDIGRVNSDWMAIIPDSRIQIIEVVNNIAMEIAEQEILELIKPIPNIRALKVERITRRDRDIDMSNDGNISFLPTKLIKIYFKGSTLPEVIHPDGIQKKVRHFIPRIKRCLKCLRFGHLKDSSKGNTRCPKCTEEHELKDCKNQPAPCVHCGSSPYNSLALGCPAYF